MLDDWEIRNFLEGVDPQLCVAFAARCSLRALPLLVADKELEAFRYWDKENCPQYILALLTALQLSINFSVFGRSDNIAVSYDIAENAARAARAVDASAAFFAAADVDTARAAHAAHGVRSARAAHAAAIITARAVLTVHVATYATGVADTAADVADEAIDSSDLINMNFKSAIFLDLETIANKTLPESKAFIYLPLWPTGTPMAWEALHQHFLQALLELDAGFDLWANWYTGRVNGVPLNFEQEQQWQNIPEEIKRQGVKAINAYLATLSSTIEVGYTLEEEQLKPLNLVRGVFIGNGATGKTSLIRKLHNEPVVEGDETMTPGIEIREWPIPDSEIKARFWDFGGQVMAHSTHQFFLRERCLYVLLVDAGSEREVREQQTANDQAEYWLEHVKAFGNSAPVILVGNKADLAQINLDMNALVEKYRNIIDFFPLSCTSEEKEFKYGFDRFQTVLIEQLKAVGTHQVMFTPNQFEVLEQIRRLSRKNAYLDYTQFDKLCVDYEIGKKGLDKKAFLGLLDALGEVIHFPELEWMDAYVLNPRWLTYGVYTLLYSAEAEKQYGVLSDSDVVRILQAKTVEDEKGHHLTYPSAKCRFIIDAMTQFKLCYNLPNKLKYVIPDKLPKDQPDLSAYFNKDAEGTLAFEFGFTGLLPRNIMPNLIVARHYEIERDKNGKQLVWQRGVILHNKEHQATARWKVDYHQRTLQLWVHGKEPREYLVILRDKVYEILKAIKGLSFREYVILPEFARTSREGFYSSAEPEKAPYDRLLKEARRGQEVTSSDSGADYVLKKVMGFIMTEEQQKKEQQKISSTGDTFNTNYNINKADIVGGAGNNQQMTITKSGIAENKPDTSSPKKWYQERWIITAVIAVLIGILTGWTLGSFIIGGITTSIAGIVFYYFNYKRRYFRVACFTLGAAIFSATPSLIVKIGLNPEMQNGKWGFLLNLGEQTNYWSMSFLFPLAAFLFWLDSKQE